MNPDLMAMWGLGDPMAAARANQGIVFPDSAMNDFGAAMASQGIGPAQALGGGMGGPYGGGRMSMMGGGGSFPLDVGTTGGGGEGGGENRYGGPISQGMGGIGSDAARAPGQPPLGAPTTIPSPAGEPRPVVGGQGPMSITPPGAVSGQTRPGGANRIAETLKGVKAPPAPPPLRAANPGLPKPSQNLRGGELMALLQALGRDVGQIPLQLGRALGGR